MHTSPSEGLRDNGTAGKYKMHGRKGIKIGLQSREASMICDVHSLQIAARVVFGKPNLVLDLTNRAFSAADARGTRENLGHHRRRSRRNGLPRTATKARISASKQHVAERRSHTAQMDPRRRSSNSSHRESNSAGATSLISSPSRGGSGAAVSDLSVHAQRSHRAIVPQPIAEPGRQPTSQSALAYANQTIQ